MVVESEYGALGAVAAELEEAQAIAAQFTGESPEKPSAGEVLAAALRAVRSAVDDMEEMEDFVAAHCGEFEAWQPNGEQHLEWTKL